MCSQREEGFTKKERRTQGESHRPSLPAALERPLDHVAGLF